MQQGFAEQRDDPGIKMICKPFFFSNVWDPNNNFYQEFVAWTIQWNTQRHSAQWFNDWRHRTATQHCLRRVSCKPLCLPPFCISDTLLQLFCSAGELQPELTAGLPWAEDFSTGTGQAKPYDRMAVGPFHWTPGGKSTICLVQTAARPSNEKTAIYRVKEKFFGFVLLLLAHKQWLFQQRKPPPPSESH